VSGASATLLLTSSLTQNEVTNELISQTAAAFSAAGATVTRQPPQGLSGFQAQRFHVKDPSRPGATCFWLVKRGRRFFTTAMCVASDDDCWTACGPVLDTLAWRTAAGVAPEDL
jgi:hypothetical protein